MTTDWTDLQRAVTDRELLLLPGLPSCSPADYFWPNGDLTGWLDAAGRLQAGIIYVTEITIAEHIDGLRYQLDQLRDEMPDDSFDVEGDQLDLWLAEIENRSGGDVIGWIGEWRYGGVSHHYAVVDVPEPLRAVHARLEAHAAVQPFTSARPILRSSVVDEPRDAAGQASEERSETGSTRSLPQ